MINTLAFIYSGVLVDRVDPRYMYDRSGFQICRDDTVRRYNQYGKDDSTSSSSSSHSSMHFDKAMHWYSLMDRMIGFMLTPRRNN